MRDSFLYEDSMNESESDCSRVSGSDQHSVLSSVLDDLMHQRRSIPYYAGYLYGVIDHSYLGRGSSFNVAANCLLSDCELLDYLSRGPSDDPESWLNVFYHCLYYMPVINSIPFCIVLLKNSQGASLSLQWILLSRALDPKRWITHPIMAYLAEPLYACSQHDIRDDMSWLACLLMVCSGLSSLAFIGYWLIEALCIDIHGAINHLVNNPESGFNQLLRGIEDRNSHASLKQYNHRMNALISSVRCLGLSFNLFVTVAFPLWLLDVDGISSSAVFNAFNAASSPMKVVSIYTLTTGLFSCALSTARFVLTHDQVTQCEAALKRSLLPT